MTSETLRDAKIGEQLIIDINRYQAHPDCQTLICFVYDPSHHLKNPEALENDLSGKHNDLAVKVIVYRKLFRLTTRGRTLRSARLL